MGSNEPDHDFGALYATHAPRVRRMLARRGIRTEDLDDVLQDTFVTIHRLLPGFEGRSSMDTWLHAITWRVASNFHRLKRHRNEVTSSGSDSIAVQPATPHAVPSVHTDLRHLEEEQRDVVALHEIAELRVAEIARLTGQARATIRARLERGRIALQRRLTTALRPIANDDWPEGTEPPLAARLADPYHVLVHEVVREEIIISTLDNIVIAVWRGDATDAAMEALIEVLFCALALHPQGIRHLCIVPLSKPPSTKTRNLMSWAANKLGPRLIACAWSAEHSMMSLVAPIMNTCMFVGGSPLNARFCSHPTQAAEWLAQYGSLNAPQIMAHVARMRSAPSSSQR